MTNNRCRAQNKIVSIYNILCKKPTEKKGKQYFRDILFKRDSRCGRPYYIGTINAVEKSTHPILPLKNIQRKI